MHRHEIAVLNALRKNKKLNLKRLLEETKLGRDEAMWAVQNLEMEGLVEAQREAREDAALTDEGRKYAREGLPESALLVRLGAGPVEIRKLAGKEEQIGFMWAKKKGLVTIDRGIVKLTEKGKEKASRGLEEEKILKGIGADKDAYEKYKDTETVSEFRGRGILETKSREEVAEIAITPKGMKVTAAEDKSSEGLEGVDRNVIKNRLWVGKNFREYNVEAPVEPKEAATAHPLRRTIDQLKNAYLSIGFREVSGPVIGPSFWNFDYLFMPQDHPAREVQDTFFLSSPKTLPIGEKNLVNRIKEEHEKAWHIEWSEDIAVQAIPRTHLTSVTGRYMNEIVNDIGKNPDKYELPVKIFSVGRVFRNENIDYKHLADFYQSDGIIIGRNLTLEPVRHAAEDIRIAGHKDEVQAAVLPVRGAGRGGRGRVWQGVAAARRRRNSQKRDNRSGQEEDKRPGVGPRRGEDTDGKGHRHKAHLEPLRAERRLDEGKEDKVSACR